MDKFYKKLEMLEKNLSPKSMDQVFVWVCHMSKPTDDKVRVNLKHQLPDRNGNMRCQCKGNLLTRGRLNPR
jgi:hypothetical protein